jgi:hypothetical protein
VPSSNKPIFLKHMVNLQIILSLTPKPFKRENVFSAGIGTSGEDEGSVQFLRGEKADGLCVSHLHIRGTTDGKISR